MGRESWIEPPKRKKKKSKSEHRLPITPGFRDRMALVSAGGGTAYGQSLFLARRAFMTNHPELGFQTEDEVWPYLCSDGCDPGHLAEFLRLQPLKPE